MPWSDADTPLATIRAALAAFNAERDWGTYHSPRNLSMALSVEANELLALYLWCADDGPQPAVPARQPKVAEEAADVLISLLNLCAAAGVDLAAATEAKLQQNAAKYPVGRSRGSLRKWSELVGSGGEDGGGEDGGGEAG